MLRLAGGGTIAMDKFIAWDTFKQKSIQSKVAGKKCIPGALRKMFMSALVRENAALCETGQEPVFASLIRPKWAALADSSVDWLTGILPQLGIWYRQATGRPISLIADKPVPAESFAGDDADLYMLALRYHGFLESHRLFEPAWETPPFADTGKNCFIFFSESLSDFHEYRELLESSPHVKIARTEPGDDDAHNREVFFYTNSRSEIAEAALYVLALHQEKKIPWELISVSIPDDEYYGPYLYREFENRNIPYSAQSGKPLSSYPAGKFFGALSFCVQTDFSFSSLTSLLLDSHLPWKHEREIRELIRFGIENNCICSWTEGDGRGKTINAWEDAFSRPFGYVDRETRELFRDIRRHGRAVCEAGSFSEIRKQYFIFREKFFDMDSCLSETDTILSRCISELMELAAIERDYPGLSVPNPFAFFCAYLGETSYLAQQKSGGVVIFPYRTAAPAPFDCHVILGASQKALSAVFTPLSFLSISRREKLGLQDTDASAAFIALHRNNSRLPAAFFCSEQAFSGYAIPHSVLEAASKPTPRFDIEPGHDGKFAADLYRAETAFFALPGISPHGGLPAAMAGKLHRNQKTGFDEWMSRRRNAMGAETLIGRGHPLLDDIRRRFGGRDELTGKIGVSSTSLGSYYKCPLLWVFDRALEIENVEIETGLMADYIGGLVFHSALCLFFGELKENGTVIDEPGADYALPESYSILLKKTVNEVFDSFPRLPGSERQDMSMLTARLLLPHKELYYSQLENFLGRFISFFSGFRIVSTEKDYQSIKETCYYNGRVDCILEDSRSNLPTGRPLAIVDFKTGKPPALSNYLSEDGLTDFQLPMYLSIAETELGREVHTALFFSIINAMPAVLFGSVEDRLGGGTVPKMDDEIIRRGSEAYSHIMGEFTEKAEKFAADISSGAFSACPEYRERCGKCGHNKVCRTLYKVYQG